MSRSTRLSFWKAGPAESLPEESDDQHSDEHVEKLMRRRRNATERDEKRERNRDGGAPDPHRSQMVRREHRRCGAGPQAPHYGEIDQFVAAPKRSKLRAFLDRVKHFLKHGDKKQAQAQLSSLADALVYTNVSLPLNETKAAVNEAQQALAKNDTPAADAALKRAENDLRMNIAAVVTPAKQASSPAR